MPAHYPYPCADPCPPTCPPICSLLTALHACAPAQVTLPELIEALIRIAIERQPAPATPVKPMPGALIELIETHIQPVYTPSTRDAEDDLLSFYGATGGTGSVGAEARPTGALGEYAVVPWPELSGAVRSMLRLHSPTSRALFEHYAKKDASGYTIRARECLAMCDAAGLLTPAPTDPRASMPTREELKKTCLRLFGAVVLGGTSDAAYALWKERFAPDEGDGSDPAADGAGGDGGAGAVADDGSGGKSMAAQLASASKSCSGSLLVGEMEEFLARFALRRFEYDRTTPEQLKVNELFQLLRVSLMRAGDHVGRRRGGVPAGYLTGAMASKYSGTGGSYVSVAEHQEPKMSLSAAQQTFEAKANAERVKAIEAMLGIKSGILKKEGGGKDGKGDKKGGGKKK